MLVLCIMIRCARAHTHTHTHTHTQVQSPEQLATEEPVVRRPLLAVRQGRLQDMRRGYWARTFCSLSRTHLRPDQLRLLLRVFANEDYLVVPSPRQRAPVIVLHQRADEVQVARAVLARALLSHELQARAAAEGGGEGGSGCSSRMDLSMEEMLPLLAQVRDEARRLLPGLLRAIGQAGWTVKDADVHLDPTACPSLAVLEGWDVQRDRPPVFVFGYIGDRALWPSTTS